MVPVVHEIDAAGLRIHGAVGQPDSRDAEARLGSALFGPPGRQGLGQLRFAHGIDHPDGIHLDDPGQGPRVGSHQIAPGVGGAADPAVDGGRNGGVIQVEPGLGQVGFGLLAPGLGLAPGRDRRIQIRGRHPARANGPQSPEIPVRFVKGGFRRRRPGLGLVDGGLVGGLLDAVEEIAGGDGRPLFKRHLLQIAPDPGPEIHGLDGLHPAHVFVGRIDLFRGHRGYDNLGRRAAAFWLGRRRGGKTDGEAHQQSEGDARSPSPPDPMVWLHKTSLSAVAFQLSIITANPPD